MQRVAKRRAKKPRLVSRDGLSQYFQLNCRKMPAPKSFLTLNQLHLQCDSLHSLRRSVGFKDTQSSDSSANNVSISSSSTHDISTTSSTSSSFSMPALNTTLNASTYSAASDFPSPNDAPPSREKSCTKRLKKLMELAGPSLNLKHFLPPLLAEGWSGTMDKYSNTVYFAPGYTLENPGKR